jgi:hypothetical protein
VKALGNYPTIYGWAHKQGISMSVAVERVRAGDAPEGLGRARRGLHGEPELLSAWAKRNCVSRPDARVLYRERKIPGAVRVRNSMPTEEWFESFPGIKHVLKVQADHGHAIIKQYKLVLAYQRRVWRWQESYRKFAATLERQRKTLHKLYGDHWALRNKIKKAETAIARGHSYLSSHDIDEIKQRLFGPDLVAAELAARRKQWSKSRGRKTITLQSLREETQADSRGA